MSLGDGAADFGKDLFADVAGTAAMTVSSTVYATATGLAYAYLDQNQTR